MFIYQYLILKSFCWQTFHKPGITIPSCSYTNVSLPEIACWTLSFIFFANWGGEFQSYSLTQQDWTMLLNHNVNQGDYFLNDIKPQQNHSPCVISSFMFFFIYILSEPSCSFDFEEYLHAQISTLRILIVCIFDWQHNAIKIKK